MMNSEVPTACFIGKLAKNNKAGIIKNLHQLLKPYYQTNKSPMKVSEN
jgi:hypothetical protein